MVKKNLDKGEDGEHCPGFYRLTNEELERLEALTKNRKTEELDGSEPSPSDELNISPDTALHEILRYDETVDKADEFVSKLTERYGAKRAYQIAMHMAAMSSSRILYRGDSEEYLADVTCRFRKVALVYIEEIDIENNHRRRTIVCCNPDGIEGCRRPCKGCPFAHFPDFKGGML